MLLFPTKIFPDVSSYVNAYADEIAKAFGGIDRGALAKAAECLLTAIHAGRTIFCCGNGGSAAIANHLVCDYSKGVQTNTCLHPRVVSLSTNIEIVTAIANDIAYDQVFVHQLRSLARPGDILMAISSSGNSPNILEALSWGAGNELGTIAMTGFDGGAARKIAQISLHVPCGNYGVVEDVHQSMMHLLAQYLRLSNLEDPGIVGTAKF
jgi:phosphoheptose isomerase